MVDLRSPPLRFLASGGDAERPGPTSLRATSSLGEGEAPVAAAAASAPEALTGALLALFSPAGDLGKKLYSVLCRDMATDGEAQPLVSERATRGTASTARRLLAGKLGGRRARRWRDSGLSRQSAGASVCAGGVTVTRARLAPSRRRGEGRGRRAAPCAVARVSPTPSPRPHPRSSPRDGNGLEPGAQTRGAGLDWNTSAGSRAQLRGYGSRKAFPLPGERWSWGLRAGAWLAGA